MNYFISTNTIKKAYEELSKEKFANASILHIYLILKGIGFNNLEYKDVELIKEKGYIPSYKISGLFSIFEKSPPSNDFINPFSMDEWGVNPTEILKKWVGGRIKNNIIGGATTWRKIILQDEDNVKFTFDYVDKIRELTIREDKISLPAMAIWANRFSIFNQKTSLTAICKQFINDFNISDYELSELFSYNSSITNVEFEEKIHDCEQIRKLIGCPKNYTDWISSIKNTEISIESEVNKILIFNKGDKYMNQEINKDFLKTALMDFNQIILSGVPGTSKSYYCNELSKDFDRTVHIQFHPQYSYQQFIGGYFVNKSDVEYRKGLFLQFVEEAIENPNKKFLLIIDEINRANTSQVFGETIQCLDRNASVEISIDSTLKIFSIPKNLFIVGTMNSTDKTIGAIDFALKRRFLTIYCPVEEDILVELCPTFDEISISDLLSKINTNIMDVLQNKEYCIGHAIFLNDNYLNNGKYIYDINRLSMVFNHKVLSMVEEYCYGDIQKIEQIVGSKLLKRLSGNEFKDAVKEFIK